MKYIYIKQCKVFIEPIAESKDKKEGTKTDKKVVHAERVPKMSDCYLERNGKF